MSRYKVFLIDDDELFSLMMPQVLKKVEEIKLYKIFKSGWDALEQLDHVENSNFPDFIFVDLNMPEMDGFEFIDRYQEKFYPSHPNTKIVVISNSVLKKDTKRSYEQMAVCDYKNKPLTSDKIRIILKENA